MSDVGDKFGSVFLGVALGLGLSFVYSSRRDSQVRRIDPSSGPVIQANDPPSATFFYEPKKDGTGFAQKFMLYLKRKGLFNKLYRSYFMNNIQQNLTLEQEYRCLFMNISRLRNFATLQREDIIATIRSSGSDTLIFTTNTEEDFQKFRDMIMAIPEQP